MDKHGLQTGSRNERLIEAPSELLLHSDAGSVAFEFQGAAVHSGGGNGADGHWIGALPEPGGGTITNDSTVKKASLREMDRLRKMSSLLIYVRKGAVPGAGGSSRLTAMDVDGGTSDEEDLHLLRLHDSPGPGSAAAAPSPPPSPPSVGTIPQPADEEVRMLYSEFAGFVFVAMLVDYYT